MTARVRLGIGLAVVFVIAIAVFPRRVSHFPVVGPEREVEIPRRDRGHGVLLVFDAESLRAGSPPGDAYEGPCDLEWENILRQRFGACDLATTDELAADPASVLAGHPLVVLTRGSLRRLPVELRPQLEQTMTSAGTAVLLETPDSTWAAALGLRVAAVEGRHQLRWPFPFALPGVEGPTMAPVPRVRALEHRAWRYAPEPRSIRERTVPALSVAGRPELWRRDVGRGAWIVLAIDLSSLSLRIRQGLDTPTGEDSWGVERSAPTRTATPALAGASRPWLDAWIEALLDAEVAPTPWPAIDPAASGSKGWLVTEPAGVTEGDPIQVETPKRPAGSSPAWRCLLGAPTDAGGGGERAPRGWNFGSTAPFRPLDRFGLTRSLWELAAHGQIEAVAEDEGLLAGWLRTNGDEARGPVLVLLPTPQEDLAQRFLAIGGEHAHRGVTGEELLAWWVARDQTTLDWSFEGDTLVVRAEPGGPDQSIRLPFLWRDWRLVDWRSDHAQVRMERGWSYGRPVRRFRLPPTGPVTLRIVYRSPRSVR